MIAITLISLLLSSLSLRARAEDHQILVGGAIAIFEPNNVTVVEGDTVTFTFINGTHSVLQSNFVFPCEFINEAEPASNGFNSGARPANNGTSVTNLTVQITGKMGWANTTTWFYDGADKSCGWDDTAAGGFNLREDSNETLAGYLRNAARLFGQEAEDQTRTTSQTRTARPSTTFSPDSGALGLITSEFSFPIALVVTAILVTFV
ncbi:hypothetical protein FRC18_002945 [Serendipita sp. 400]|nr:hypothetical protein FRC18_002945 [Serendipita sp. 400]